MPITGNCDYKKCESLCCRQLRLFYPKAIYIKPMSDTVFLFPLDEYNKSNKMSNGEYKKLLGWRGVSLDTLNTELMQFTVSEPQKWTTIDMDSHIVLILPKVPCRYLRDNGTCRIHDRKPAICKDFPRGEMELNDKCSFKWISNERIADDIRNTDKKTKKEIEDLITNKIKQVK